MRPVNDLQAALTAYDPDADIALLGKAYDFGREAHEGQVRANGKPYFEHPIEVAMIAADLELDQATVITALLHDVVEDTPISVAEINQQFGEDVASLVDGVTKLSVLELKSKRTKQAENFQKLMVAASEDVRVLLVKLADRLHNMRTLHPLRPDKRVRISHETMDIYAPLAERMGMAEMKDELKDIAFSYINPEGREAVKVRLDAVMSDGMKLVEGIIYELEGVLRLNSMEPKISGRVKTLYSIFEKMTRKEVEFDQLSDIMGFRLILPSISDCYAALGYLHGAYQMVPGRFKDYISLPKRNGYKSLHTGLIGPKNRKIEIQIRTPKMHELAEKGVAAHFSYKRGDIGLKSAAEFGWLRQLQDIMEASDDPEELLEHSKIDLFAD
ncbi:MAG: RelA/SpoT family protein, partial [Alphaproteobacteria bacterium]